MILEEIYELQELLNSSGYDAIINEKVFHLIKDGRVVETDIKYIENLLTAEKPHHINDIASILTENHKKGINCLGFNEPPTKISIEISEIERKLNQSDPEIKSLYNRWDKGDCSLVGIVEIYLYQCIKEHKEKNGSYYDTDYDEITLRYGQTKTNK
jgi:hypothetical protein